jgi:hypothetical protein
LPYHREWSEAIPIDGDTGIARIAAVRACRIGNIAIDAAFPAECARMERPMTRELEE